MSRKLLMICLANGHPGPRGHSLAHLLRGYDPQQPLHAQVGKYSNTILLLSMILINHDRLGTDWHLDASIRSVCSMNFNNLLHHFPGWTGVQNLRKKILVLCVASVCVRAHVMRVMLRGVIFHLYTIRGPFPYMEWPP